YDLRTDAERPLVADKQACQVVSGNVFDWSAELADRPVGHHHFGPQNVVYGNAVLESVWSSRIRGEISADGTGSLAAGVGSVMESGPLEVLREMDIDQARLDDGIAVTQVDFQNSPHARQRDHHAAADRQTASGETRPGTTRHKGDLVLIAEFDDRHHLLGASRKDHDVRNAFLDRESVTFVNQQFVFVCQEPVIAYDRAQCGQKFGHDTLSKRSRSGSGHGLKWESPEQGLFAR